MEVFNADTGAEARKVRYECPGCHREGLARIESLGRAGCCKRCGCKFKLPKHLRVACRKCGETVRTRADLLGRQVACRKCHGSFWVGLGDSLTIRPDVVPERKRSPTIEILGIGPEIAPRSKRLDNPGTESLVPAGLDRADCDSSRVASEIVGFQEILKARLKERERLLARLKMVRDARSRLRVELARVRTQLESREAYWRETVEAAHHARDTAQQLAAEADRIGGSLIAVTSERDEIRQANEELLAAGEERAEVVKQLREALAGEIARGEEVESLRRDEMHLFRQRLATAEAGLRREADQTSSLKALLSQAELQREGLRTQLAGRDADLAGARGELVRADQARSFLEERRYCLENDLLREQARAGALRMELETARREADSARVSVEEARALLERTHTEMRELVRLRENLEAELAATEQDRIVLREDLRASNIKTCQMSEELERARSEAIGLASEVGELRSHLEAARRRVESLGFEVDRLSAVVVEERGRAERAELRCASGGDPERLVNELAEAREFLARAMGKVEENQRNRELLEAKVGDLQRLVDVVTMNLGAAEDRARRAISDTERARKHAALLATERDQLAAEHDRLLRLHHESRGQSEVVSAPTGDRSKAADLIGWAALAQSSTMPAEGIATVDHLISQWSTEGFRRFRSRRGN